MSIVLAKSYKYYANTYVYHMYLYHREDPINIEEGASDPQSTGPTIVGNDLDQMTTFTSAPDEHPRLVKLLSP